jgi:predicted DNA-binding protein
MKKNHIRISLDVSPELAEKLKAEADKKDITLNATIRLILQRYFEEIAE